MYQNIDDDDDIDPYQASSFYGFSFIELSDSSEDSWSVNSSNAVSVSTLMDMSLLVTNDFSNQIQSTLIASTVQQHPLVKWLILIKKLKNLSNYGYKC
ncbi:unnamed protein product [Rotaria magnacalcarata]